MKYKLDRPLITQEMSKILAREIRRQKMYVALAKKDRLKEMAAVCRSVKKSGLPNNLVCKKLSEKLGHGIFLHPDAKPILRGEVIGTYAGIVSLVPQFAPDDSAYAFAPLLDMRLSKKEQEKYDKGRPFHPRRLYSMLIDAEKKGNFTRFINHSEKPNVAADLFKIPSNSYGLFPSPLEVVYVAKKRINPGEQLLVSYEGEENSYWDVLNIKPYPMTPQTFQLDASLKLIKTSR